MDASTANPWVGVYPYPSMFDPSQMSNPYSTYNGVSFNPYNYGGSPVNALGRVIPQGGGQPANAPPAPQQTPGTSLASSPYSSWFSGNPLITNPPTNVSPAAYASLVNNAYPQPTSGPQTDWAALSQPYQPRSNPMGSVGQQSGNMGVGYLQAMANPGNPRTPGVPIPSGGAMFQPSGGNVLQSFLANRGQNQGTGVGAGFINNLMRAQGQ